MNNPPKHNKCSFIGLLIELVLIGFNRIRIIPRFSGLHFSSQQSRTSFFEKFLNCISVQFCSWPLDGGLEPH